MPQQRAGQHRQEVELSNPGADRRLELVQHGVPDGAVDPEQRHFLRRLHTARFRAGGPGVADLEAGIGEGEESGGIQLVYRNRLPRDAELTHEIPDLRGPLPRNVLRP